MLIGVINKIPRFEDGKPRYFLFVNYEGKGYFFHRTQFQGDWAGLIKTIENEKEAKVKFEIDQSIDGKFRAKNVSQIL